MPPWFDTAARALVAAAFVLTFAGAAQAQQIPPPGDAGTRAPAGDSTAQDAGIALGTDAGTDTSAAEAGDGATGASASDAGSVDPNALTPPKLLTFVDAGYPEEARAQGIEAAVILVITIGSDGLVEDVLPTGPPAGWGFDDLAVAAARRFVFEPARKGGQPMRSRIQYRYDFKLQPPEPEAPALQAPPEARLSVALRSLERDQPIADAEIVLAIPDDPAFARRITTDKAGHASADGLTPGRYELTLNHPKYTGERHIEELLPDQLTELTYRLGPARDYEEYGAVARVQAPPREVTRRTIEREELTRVAGTRGDALRTIELLPGVSRPPFTAGLVLIRGSAPGDSTVLLDGVQVPLLYHFGGLTSFINSRALERINFYPGNFSARYGRAMGGIIDVGVRDPATDGYHGVIDVNLPLDSSLLLEGPITDKSSFLVAGRRSYFGEVLTAFAPDNVGQLAAPVYYDYQGFVTYRPTDRDRLRFGLYGASDRLDVLFADDDEDPTITSIEVGQQFHRAQIGWRRQYTKKLEHELTFSAGRESTVFRLPPAFTLDLLINQMYLRAEWRYRLNDVLQIIVGTDDAFGQYDVSYEGPPLTDQNQAGEETNFEQQEDIRFIERNVSYAASAYLELAITPVKSVRIVPGMRVDYYDLTQRFSYDPRIAAIYSVREGTRLKAGVGLFSQPPEPPLPFAGIGNPNLRFNKAIHYSAGIEHDFTDDLSLNVEGFYKSLYDLVVGTDFEAAAAMMQTNPPPFDNDGIGRIYGLEVAGRKNAKGRWFGFLSYTLMRSERKDHDQPWRLFNFDQTHILSVAGTVRVGRGWELGGTLRVVTGNPRTPIVGASFDQDTGSYTAENGRLNSRRSPTFNRLDVRAEKTWRFDRWRLAFYLDVQNVYNSKNPEGVTYNFNYKEHATIRGLPIIPVLGLRGEL